jgi:hypothetical protein
MWREDFRETGLVDIAKHAKLSSYMLVEAVCA